MRKLITTVLVASALSACGGGTSSPEQAAAQPEALLNPYEESTLSYSAQQVATQDSETAQLTVATDFDFAPSETVQISLDFPEARNDQATVLICTDYALEQGEYEIDYDSCAMRAPLLNGRIDHEMKVVNRYDSVLGVVWFAQPGTEPLYQEITL